MHQRKSKKVLIYFFLLLIVSSIGNHSINNFKLSKIQKINILGLEQKNNQIILNKIKNLSLENIFFIDKNEIEKIINSNSLIERYTVFKEYHQQLTLRLKNKFFSKNK